jgi:tRNA(Ile)-lysidine synthase
VNPVLVLEQFFKQHHLVEKKILLALSGGIDSLSLFYCLLQCKLSFHIAHVDHSWRQESAQEAYMLQQLAAQHRIPFHLKKLDLTQATHNLEDYCRKQRYAFFKTICSQYDLEGVLLGHQGNDQVETVLKRLLEGSHWSHLSALKSDSQVYGIRALRPFLTLTKQVLQDWLSKNGHIAFNDPTNNDPTFLRGRMRQVIFPWLNQTFGKNIYSALMQLEQDAAELNAFFDARIEPLLDQTMCGPFGAYLDLSCNLPQSMIEIKYLVRKFFESQQVSVSRSILATSAHLLEKGEANKMLKMGSQSIWIDRKHIFILNPLTPFDEKLRLTPGKWVINKKWVVEVEKTSRPLLPSSWKEGWKGQFRAWVPAGDYQLAKPMASASYRGRKTTLRKWWNAHKIPAFLRDCIPVVWGENAVICECLTGKWIDEKKEVNGGLEIRITYQIT